MSKSLFTETAFYGCFLENRAKTDNRALQELPQSKKRTPCGASAFCSILFWSFVEKVPKATFHGGNQKKRNGRLVLSTSQSPQHRTISYYLEYLY
jgi:hypothetical protein